MARITMGWGQMLFVAAFVSLVIPAVLAVPSEDEDNGEGKIWAVLVAGSNTYINYRHQANVCHAYQLLHKNGIPDSQIIVMMYDDIANNPSNPHKGVIINKPDGPNVYGPKEVPKDYVGENVNPQNFINVLTGNSGAVDGVGSGRVLKSGPNDHVFVYFADHGGKGSIYFPNWKPLYAHELIKALNEMHEKKMYKKLVFYLEACESGSMFENMLPSDINIFATTACKPNEHSFGCYEDHTVGAFLGDIYSVAWMEDTEAAQSSKNFTGETLFKQFRDVVERVKESQEPQHPQMYGDMSMKKDLLKSYLGNSLAQREQPAQLERFKDAVSSRDVDLHVLKMKIRLAKNDEEKAALIKERDILLKERDAVDHLFSRILDHVTSQNVEDIRMLESSHQPLSLDMMPCYKTLVENLRQSCLNIIKNTYALGHLYKLANLCSLQYSSTDKVLQAYRAACTDYHGSLSGVN